MPVPKVHYYLLQGDSLRALNRLIEYDRIKTDWQLEELTKKMKRTLDPFAPPSSAPTDITLPSAFCGDFGTANIASYKARLGFAHPPVQVVDYGDGTLYRAYHALPKIAMNPGTSKANFGLADLVNDPKADPKERVAIYLSYEDYKGQHFAPPDAQKLTDDEFADYDEVSGSFQFYRTYDEGVAMPADFDPTVHLTTPRLAAKDWSMSRTTHRFILDAPTQKIMAGYEAAYSKWRQKQQDFRSENMDQMVGLAFCGNAPRVGNAQIDDLNVSADARQLRIYLSKQAFARHRHDILKNCEITAVADAKFLGLQVTLKPRLTTGGGDTLARLLAAYPVMPVKPAVLDFVPPAGLQGLVRFDETILGFPYMQIERPADPDVRLLALRLPAHMGQVAPPTAECQPLSADDYMALSASEDYYDLQKPPSHVFRLTGGALQQLQNYETACAAHVNGSKSFIDELAAVLNAAAPGCTISDYNLFPYSFDNDDSRRIDLTLSDAHYEALRPVLATYFNEKSSYANGADKEFRILQLSLRKDTSEGAALLAKLEEVQSRPDFPADLSHALGLTANNGIGLMALEPLPGMTQTALIYNLPAYITGVTAPPGTVQLTQEELLHIVADSMDITAGSVPPPCPPHLSHLPTAAGYGTDKHVKKLKSGKDEEGLPLHPRSDSSWFAIKPRR